MAKTEQTGLYDATNEHDACGVGMVVNIHGNKSHELVDSALKVLENMRHRGAEGADNKTGDGAGIMLQIPHEFILLQGIPVPEKVGNLFLFDEELMLSFDKKMQSCVSVLQFVVYMACLFSIWKLDCEKYFYIVSLNVFFHDYPHTTKY